MEALDPNDTCNKIFPFKRRLLKIDKLLQEHAQLQADNEALIKGYKVIEDKEKETARRLQKYVKGCGRLLKENEWHKKEIETLQETLLKNLNSLEMSRLENERLDGALKMFQEERKFLHSSNNCIYRNDRVHLIRFCNEVFKNRLKFEKACNMYKCFQKKYDEDFKGLKLEILTFEKVHKKLKSKLEEHDSDLDGSLNDYSEEFQPIDSVESGYHENDSIIESIQSKSDCKLDQDFGIQENINLNQNFNERWLDVEVKASEIVSENLAINKSVDQNAACTKLKADAVEITLAITEVPEPSSRPSEFSCLQNTQFEKATELILPDKNLPDISNKNTINFSLFTSPGKETFLSVSETKQESFLLDNKNFKDNYPVEKNVSVSPDSLSDKAIYNQLKDLRTYCKREKIEKVKEKARVLETLATKSEKDLMEKSNVKRKEGEIVMMVKKDREASNLEKPGAQNKNNTIKESGINWKEEEAVILKERKAGIIDNRTIKEVDSKLPEVEGKKIKLIDSEEKVMKTGSQLVVKTRIEQFTEKETSDNEILKMFEEMKLPLLISPIKSKSREPRSENKKIKRKMKNKNLINIIRSPKTRHKQEVKDEKEWQDALYAVLSIKKNDITAKAIVDVLKKSRIKKCKKKKKVIKRPCWAIEDLEENFLEEEKTDRFTNEKNIFINQINIPEVSEKRVLEGFRDSQKNVEEVLEKQKPENLSKEISVQIEAANDFQVTNFQEELAKGEKFEHQNNCYAKRENNFINFKIDGHNKNETSEEFLHDNLNGVTLNLSNKPSFEKTSKLENFKVSSENALLMNISESTKLPIVEFLSKNSQNEDFEKFVENTLEASFAENQEYAHGSGKVEKELLESGDLVNGKYKNFQEGFSDSSVCPEIKDNFSEIQFVKKKQENIEIESSPTCDFDDQILKIISGESNGSSSDLPSPLNSIPFSTKLISPISVHNYQLRSLAPSSPSKLPFPRIKFIDNTPFNSYDLAFQHYYLSNRDVSYSDRESKSRDKNFRDPSPIERNLKQCHKRKRKLKKADNSGSFSSDSEAEAFKRKQIPALVQEKEENASLESKINFLEEIKIAYGNSNAGMKGSEEPCYAGKVTQMEIPDDEQEKSFEENRKLHMNSVQDAVKFGKLKSSSVNIQKRRRIQPFESVEVCSYRKLILTDSVQKKLRKNVSPKKTKATLHDLELDVAPEVEVISGLDNKNQNQEEIPHEEKGFVLDSILTGMTKQKEEFKAPPRRVAVLLPVYEQVSGLPKIQATPTRSSQALEDNIDWKCVYNNMNIENLDPVPVEDVIVNNVKLCFAKENNFKVKFKDKKICKFVKNELEKFAQSNIETAEEAEKCAKKCLSYLVNVPEDIIAKEAVTIILENVDEEIIQFEKPAPPLTKTQHRLLIIFSLLQKTSTEFQNLTHTILKLISQKFFPEKFFWPDDSLESASRFYAALCKQENNFQSIWKFCFCALSEMQQRFSIIIHTVLLIWPDILHDAEIIKSNLLINTFVQIILQTPKSNGRQRELQAQQRKLMALKELLRMFYHFNVNNTLDSYLKDLLSEFCKGTEKSEESINLLVKCKTFEWLSTFFVPEVLKYLNSWAERKIESYLGIKFLNFLKQVSNKETLAKNLNAKVNKMVSCLIEILSSGKMKHEEEEEIVEVLISFTKYVKVIDVLPKWNIKSVVSQSLQEKISKAKENVEKSNNKSINKNNKLQKTKLKVKNLNNQCPFKVQIKKKRKGNKQKKKKPASLDVNTVNK